MILQQSDGIEASSLLLCNQKCVFAPQLSSRRAEAAEAAEQPQAPSWAAEASSSLLILSQRAFVSAATRPNAACSCRGHHQGGELSLLPPVLDAGGSPQVTLPLVFFSFFSSQRGKRVSQIRIRRAPPREASLTPMGLPKVKR